MLSIKGLDLSILLTPKQVKNVYKWILIINITKNVLKKECCERKIMFVHWSITNHPGLSLLYSYINRITPSKTSAVS